MFARLVAILAFLLPAMALAHPMGNFSISHYALLRPEGTTLHLRYRLDFAEIPAAQELRDFDTDKNGVLSATEAAALLAARGPELLGNLSLRLNGQPAPLTLGRTEAFTRPGAASLPTLVLTFDLKAPLPAAGYSTLSAEYSDANFPERTGWSEVVTPRELSGWTLTQTSASTRDETEGLTRYPDSALAAPPNVRSATVAYTRSRQPANAGTSAQAAPPTSQPAVSSIGSPSNGSPSAGSSSIGSSSTPADAFTRLIRPGKLSGGAMAISLVIAAGMGALHALSPGHGKTVVAAYLVGSRGTARHALLLGAVVTLTHTAGVLALGLTVTLAGNHLPATVYPWLSFVSGLLILSLGVYQLSRRLTLAAGYAPPRDPHDLSRPGGHSHAMPAKVTPGALIALGVSGGLLPCPQALVVLLGAVALGQAALGLVLVVVFSLGLALTLTAIGLTLVYARNYIASRNLELRFAPKLAIASAAAITLVGLVLTTTALFATGALTGT